MWLIVPRPNHSLIGDLVEKSFERSEASNAPVLFERRVRGCHQPVTCAARDNKRPPLTVWEAAEAPRRDVSRIVLPPANFLHEVEKIEHRWPAAIQFVRENRLNERFGQDADVGIIVQGGLFNTLNRALELIDVSDSFGDAKLPIYVLKVTYPLIPDEVRDICAGKSDVLMIGAGHPEFLAHEFKIWLRRGDLPKHRWE